MANTKLPRIPTSYEASANWGERFSAVETYGTFAIVVPKNTTIKPYLTSIYDQKARSAKHHIMQTLDNPEEAQKALNDLETINNPAPAKGVARPITKAEFAAKTKGLKKSDLLDLLMQLTVNN